MARTNINTATADQLAVVPGLNVDLAELIVKHRNEHGPFATVDDLLQVDAIDERILARARPHLTVGPPDDETVDVVLQTTDGSAGRLHRAHGEHRRRTPGRRRQPGPLRRLHRGGAGGHPVARDPGPGHAEGRRRAPRAGARRQRPGRRADRRPAARPEGHDQGRPQGLRDHAAQHRPRGGPTDPRPRPGDRRRRPAYGLRPAGRPLGRHPGQPAGRRLPGADRGDDRRAGPLHRSLPARHVHRRPRHGRAAGRTRDRDHPPRGRRRVPRVGAARARAAGARGGGRGLRLQGRYCGPTVAGREGPGARGRHLLHRRRRRPLRRLHQARPHPGGVLVQLRRPHHRAGHPRPHPRRTPQDPRQGARVVPPRAGRAAADHPGAGA